MDLTARLLYKSITKNTPSPLPVYYYGMPNGRIYLLYARIYEINFEKTGLEFVFAILKDFRYNSELSTIFYKNYIETCLSDFIDTVEKTNQDIKIKKVYRNMNSYSEAKKRLHKKAKKASALLELV